MHLSLQFKPQFSIGILFLKLFLVRTFDKSLSIAIIDNLDFRG